MTRESLAAEITNLPTKDLIKTMGGWIEGHVTFENGEHGNGYVDNLRFLKHPRVMTEIGRRLAWQFNDYQGAIDAVVGPSIIGAIVAYATAMHLDVPFTTTYRQYGTGEMTFHRGFVPPAGSRCLFTDDFVFSGNCLKDNVTFMQENGLIVVGASVIGMRHSLDLETPVRSLINVDFVKTSAQDCVLCQNGIPILATDVRE